VFLQQTKLKDCLFFILLPFKEEKHQFACELPFEDVNSWAFVEPAQTYRLFSSCQFVRLVLNLNNIGCQSS
jgi:hypothetical protein